MVIISHHNQVFYFKLYFISYQLYNVLELSDQYISTDIYFFLLESLRAN